MKILKQDPFTTISQIIALRRGKLKETLVLCLKVSPVLGLAAVFALLLYKYHRNKQVRLHFHPSAQNLRIAAHLAERVRGFSPTFYLPFALMKCLFVMDDKLKHLDEYRRMKYKLADGEVLQLDWYPRHYKDMPVETPVVFFVPGMFGTSQDVYSLTFCKMVYKRLGWRTFVYNRRLFISPLKGTRIISYTCFSDWREVLLHLKQAYPRTPVYLVGVSMGALNIQKYLIEFKADPMVEAAVAISSPFDAVRTNEHLQNSLLLNKAVCHTMVGMFRDHLHHEEFLQLCGERGIDPQAVTQAKTIKEFHERLTCKDVGLATPTDYYESVSTHRAIDQVSVPMLSVNSLDDPLIPADCVPLRQIEENPNLVHLMVGGGGHIEYFHGLRREFWAFDLALDYLHLLHGSPAQHAHAQSPVPE